MRPCLRAGTWRSGSLPVPVWTLVCAMLIEGERCGRPSASLSLICGSYRSIAAMQPIVG